MRAFDLHTLPSMLFFCCPFFGGSISVTFLEVDPKQIFWTFQTKNRSLMDQGPICRNEDLGSSRSMGGFGNILLRK